MPRRSAADRELAVHRRLMRFGEAENLATPMWEQQGTTVASIEAQLSRLWDAPAQAANDGDEWVTEKGMPHSRASVLNLIVTVSDAAAADRVVGTLLGLGIRHPSRAIILVADQRSPGPVLDARISTHCHDGGAAERVCYEEVVLTVRGEAAEHLAGIVAPLLIHDLPTFVWWPGAPPFRDAVFEQLVELADRLIIDSADFSDLLVGMRRLTALHRRSGVGDLAWERLAPWQERIAQFFDAPRFRRYLPNLNRLTIRYAVAPDAQTPDADEQTPGAEPPGAPTPGVQKDGSSAPLAQAMLLAGWLAARLRWQPFRTDEALADGSLRLRLEGRYEMIDLRIRPEPTEFLPPGELTSIHLGSYGETGAAEFIIDRSGDEATIATNADGMTALLRRVTMEVPREEELLSQQLVDDRGEPTYEAALRAATAFLAVARPEDVARAAASAVSPAQELGG